LRESGNDLRHTTSFLKRAPCSRTPRDIAPSSSFVSGLFIFFKTIRARGGPPTPYLAYDGHSSRTPVHWGRTTPVRPAPSRAQRRPDCVQSGGFFDRLHYPGPLGRRRQACRRICCRNSQRVRTTARSGDAEPALHPPMELAKDNRRPLSLTPAISCRVSAEEKGAVPPSRRQLERVLVVPFNWPEEHDGLGYSAALIEEAFRRLAIRLGMYRPAECRRWTSLSRCAGLGLASLIAGPLGD
jgi:hypothetical protein